MSKAFTKESEDADDDEEVGSASIPAGTRTYLTPAGYARLRAELISLLDVERPKVVDVVSWAAKNGDRSENGDYISGKRRLREIDRRIRFLTKRMDLAAVVDPSVHHGSEQIFFGATVSYCDQHGQERTITIVGIDELDPLNGKISWVAPVARALTKARVGDVITFHAPHGVDELEVLEVHYPAPSGD